MKTLGAFCVIAMLVALVWLDTAATGAADPAPSGVEMRGTRRIVRLPEIKAQLPDAPGKDLVSVSCGVCHTANYITLQPPFPRETWIAEVTKMRKTYMAPIPDEKVDEIVNYLVAVRGK